MTEVATATGLTRATARRFLHTLEQLDYLRADGRGWSLSPKVLTLGYAYISSQGVGPIAIPHMEALAHEINEAITVGALLDTGYVVIARADSERILTAPVVVGTTRQTIHASALGKVLAAFLPTSERESLLERITLNAFTPRTITDKSSLQAHLEQVREQGWAASDEEIEKGLVSVGAPIRRGERVVAAINITSHTGRITMTSMTEDILPRLISTAAAISKDLALTA